MRRLTVMLVVNDLRIGGAERLVVELARGLDKQRYRVIVTTLYRGQPFESDLLGEPGISLLSLDRSGKYDIRAVFRLAGMLRREGVDIIQPFLAPATAIGMAGAMLAKTPVRVVTECCGVRLNTHLGDRAYRFAENRLTRSADTVVANSIAGFEYVASRGVPQDKVRVVYNGVAADRLRTTLEEREETRASLGVSPDDWLIGMVASLTPAKDHGTFLQAASIVRAEVPGTRFVLVGDGPLRTELKRRAQVLGLERSVFFAGHQTRVAPYIGAMDVAVLSSNDHEGCSNFLLEAMGLGRPIVATDVGGNRELFTSGEPGFLIPPGNPLIMAHGILQVMRNPEAAERMRERAREIFRERFTLPRMVSAYDDIYQRLWRRQENKKAERALEGGITER